MIMNILFDTKYYLPRPSQTEAFSRDLCRLTASLNKRNVFPSILCIGTDRVTGDSLGPMTGTRLLTLCPGLPVYGTLAQPVHARNLARFMERFRARHPEAFLIAVDASVGDRGILGHIGLSPGALHPGGGVNRRLEPVGDITVTGVVGERSPCSEEALLSVRLSLVDLMAGFISRGVYQALTRNKKKISEHRL